MLGTALHTELHALACNTLLEAQSLSVLLDVLYCGLWAALTGPAAHKGAPGRNDAATMAVHIASREDAKITWLAPVPNEMMRVLPSRLLVGFASGRMCAPGKLRLVDTAPLRLVRRELAVVSQGLVQMLAVALRDRCPVVPVIFALTLVVVVKAASERLDSTNQREILRVRVRWHRCDGILGELSVHNGRDFPAVFLVENVLDLRHPPGHGVPESSPVLEFHDDIRNYPVPSLLDRVPFWLQVGLGPPSPAVSDKIRLGANSDRVDDTVAVFLVDVHAQGLGCHLLHERSRHYLAVSIERVAARDANDIEPVSSLLEDARTSLGPLLRHLERNEHPEIARTPLASRLFLSPFLVKALGACALHRDPLHIQLQGCSARSLVQGPDKRLCHSPVPAVPAAALVVPLFAVETVELLDGAPGIVTATFQRRGRAVVVDRGPQLHTENGEFLDVVREFVGELVMVLQGDAGLLGVPPFVAVQVEAPAHVAPSGLIAQILRGSVASERPFDSGVVSVDIGFLHAWPMRFDRIRHVPRESECSYLRHRHPRSFLFNI